MVTVSTAPGLSRSEVKHHGRKHAVVEYRCSPHDRHEGGSERRKAKP